MGYHGLVRTKNYAHFKDLIKILYKELGLTPEEYNERVYFESFSSYSQKLLQLIRRDEINLVFSKALENRNQCFKSLIKNK